MTEEITTEQAKEIATECVENFRKDRAAEYLAMCGVDVNTCGPIERMYFHAYCYEWIKNQG